MYTRQEETTLGLLYVPTSPAKNYLLKKSTIFHRHKKNKDSPHQLRGLPLLMPYRQTNHLIAAVTRVRSKVNSS